MLKNWRFGALILDGEKLNMNILIVFPFLALLTYFPNEASHTTTYLRKTIRQWPGASKICSKGSWNSSSFQPMVPIAFIVAKAPYQFEGNEKEYTAGRKEHEA